MKKLVDKLAFGNKKEAKKPKGLIMFGSEEEEDEEEAEDDEVEEEVSDEEGQEDSAEIPEMLDKLEECIGKIRAKLASKE